MINPFASITLRSMTLLVILICCQTILAFYSLNTLHIKSGIDAFSVLLFISICLLYEKISYFICIGLIIHASLGLLAKANILFSVGLNSDLTIYLISTILVMFLQISLGLYIIISRNLMNDFVKFKYYSPKYYNVIIGSRPFVVGVIAAFAGYKLATHS